MLKSSFAVVFGPAGVRRRPFLYAAAALAAALLVLGLLVPSCGAKSPPDVEGARRAVRAAVRLVRPSAPQQARFLERLAADAETATAGEIADPSQSGRAHAAWLRVVVAARKAAQGVRSQRDAARQRYQVLLPAVAGDIARARAELREAGMGRREASAMERAAVALATAQRLAGGGQYGPAADKLEGAREMATVVHASFRALHSRFADRNLLREWRAWVASAILESRLFERPVIVVDKLRRDLIVYQRGERVATFAAELGANGLKRKAHAGDQATPEGNYRVVERKQGQNTNFYKALLINYPNDDDRARFADGKRQGTIPRRAGIGSLIEIHGEGGEGRDWTDGCVALTNRDMDWVFDHAPVGTLVVIVGTV